MNTPWSSLFIVACIPLACTANSTEITEKTTAIALGNAQAKEKPAMPNATNEHKSATEQATQALAKKLKVKTTEIRMVHVTSMNWPDSSLGCPVEGMHYMQVITPGYKVTLQHAQRAYHVHTAKGRAIVCDAGTKPKRVEPKKPLVFSQKQIESLAKADLARRLGCQPQDVSISKSSKVQWNDSALGCPQKGQMYATVITPGYTMTLKYQGIEYTYHADERRVLPCPPIASE